MRQEVEGGRRQTADGRKRSQEAVGQKRGRRFWMWIVPATYLVAFSPASCRLLLPPVLPTSGEDASETRN
jgi:hypothetical protein